MIVAFAGSVKSESGTVVEKLGASMSTVAPAVDGATLAVVPVATTAFVAVAPVVPVVVGVDPPHDAAITNARTRTAELPLFTTKPP